MALKPAPLFGAELAAAAGSLDPVGIANWINIAAVINAQFAAADVEPAAGVPPMTVTAAPGAVAGKGKIT